MSDRELRDWLTFTADHPLPDELVDVHGAMICAIVANLARGDGQPPFAVADFLVLHRRAVPEVELPADAVEVSEAERFVRTLRR